MLGYFLEHLLIVGKVWVGRDLLLDTGIGKDLCLTFTGLIRVGEGQGGLEPGNFGLVSLLGLWAVLQGAGGLKLFASFICQRLQLIRIFSISKLGLGTAIGYQGIGVISLGHLGRLLCAHLLLGDDLTGLLIYTAGLIVEIIRCLVGFLTSFGINHTASLTLRYRLLTLGTGNQCSTAFMILAILIVMALVLTFKFSNTIVRFTAFPIKLMLLRIDDNHGMPNSSCKLIIACTCQGHIHNQIRDNSHLFLGISFCHQLRMIRVSFWNFVFQFRIEPL